MATKWSEAARWYHRAVELGRGDAWLDLARGFTSGARGAPVDPAEGLRCWERAAEGRASGPVAAVAEAYETGRFGETPIPRDADKARRFAELGLNPGEGGGSAVCQLVYARLLAAGDAGLPVDPEGAALWSRIAARPGERAQTEAQGLHDALWASLDAEARARVDARDRTLRPGA
jgi:TPR repeat protein